MGGSGLTERQKRCPRALRLDDAEDEDWQTQTTAALHCIAWPFGQSVGLESARLAARSLWIGGWLQIPAFARPAKTKLTDETTPVKPASAPLTIFCPPPVRKTRQNGERNAAKVLRLRMADSYACSLEPWVCLSSLGSITSCVRHFQPYA